MRRAMYLLGFLSDRDFVLMVFSNMIVNCPVTFEYVKNAENFGLNVTSLKGKLVRRKPVVVVTDYAKIPREILESRKELEASTDIMFVNILALLVRISKGLKFTTIEYLSKKLENS